MARATTPSARNQVWYFEKKTVVLKASPLRPSGSMMMGANQARQAADEASMAKTSASLLTVKRHLRTISPGPAGAI